MKYFKIDEFRCKDGSVTPERAKANIMALVDNVLDPAHERYGKGIKVKSGYRTEAYNRQIKGANDSQHCCKGGSAAADICALNSDYGCMMDWKAGNLEIAKAIVAVGQWDQMILYVDNNGTLLPRLTSSTSDATQDSPSELGSPSLLPRFVHVSWKREGYNRREIRKKVTGQSGYPLLTVDEMKQLK